MIFLTFSKTYQGRPKSGVKWKTIYRVDLRVEQRKGGTTEREEDISFGKKTRGGLVIHGKVLPRSQSGTVCK